jgi:hypothetical protein
LGQDRLTISGARSEHERRIGGGAKEEGWGARGSPLVICDQLEAEKERVYWLQPGRHVRESSLVRGIEPRPENKDFTIVPLNFYGSLSINEILFIQSARFLFSKSKIFCVCENQLFESGPNSLKGTSENRPLK